MREREREREREEEDFVFVFDFFLSIACLFVVFIQTPIFLFSCIFAVVLFCSAGFRFIHPFLPCIYTHAG